MKFIFKLALWFFMASSLIFAGQVEAGKGKHSGAKTRSRVLKEISQKELYRSKFRGSIVRK